MPLMKQSAAVLCGCGVGVYVCVCVYGRIKLQRSVWRCAKLCLALFGFQLHWISEEFIFLTDRLLC